MAVVIGSMLGFVLAVLGFAFFGLTFATAFGLYVLTGVGFGAASMCYGALHRIPKARQELAPA